MFRLVDLSVSRIHRLDTELKLDSIIPICGRPADIWVGVRLRTASQSNLTIEWRQAVNNNSTLKPHKVSTREKTICKKPFPVHTHSVNE